MLTALLLLAAINGVVLVADKGRIVEHTASGFADVAKQIPNTTDTRFQTASISKTFTSTAVLQLRDKRSLRLDDPVARHLRDFPFPDITIRHLLSHTSGLPDLELFEPLIAEKPEHIVSNADVIPALRSWKQPLAFAPGAQFRYSNTNYMLLALVIQKVSGMPYARYLERFIFKPAGMRDSYVLTGVPDDPKLAKNHMLATMYKPTPEDVATLSLKDERKMGRIRYETRTMGRTLGDQNVISTTGDLFRFDRALSNGTLLKQSTMDEAATPVKLNDGTTYADAEPTIAYGGLRCSYALGWEVCDDPAIGKIVSHAGYNRGIATMFYRNVTKNQTVVAFDNTDGDSFSQRVGSIVAALNGKPPLELETRKSLTREYGETLLRKGAAAALVRYNEMRADAANYVGTQRGLNVLGYDLLFNGYTAEALEPFRINVILHPDDFNVYDSYAEALAANGRKSDAVLMYRKSLALNPKNEGGRRKLEELEKN
jgi:CubicO group peptidase (beta-lactamase class C family)